MSVLDNKDFTLSTEYKDKGLDFFRKLWHEEMNKLVVPKGYDDFEYLKSLSYDGLYRRYSNITDKIKNRIEYELDSIRSMDLIGGFLIVYDLINYARSNNLAIAPGCGAWPGSLVSYCLDITDIDPFRYNLYFERLVNRLRPVNNYLCLTIQMEQGGCKQLMEYVKKKYGEGMPALLESIDIKLRELKELSIIKETAQRITQITGMPIDLTWTEISDEAVFAFIEEGKADDLFMLDDIYSKEFISKQKINSFEDLVARLALDRPGPDYFTCPQYIENQNLAEEIKYECPELASILKPTYGCIVYQEQVMQILCSIGGFSAEQSDITRRSMAKKLLAEVEQGKKDFILGNEEKGILGCVTKGLDKSIADKLYDGVSRATPYAFNKSHAVGCALITYQMAWLKYYHNTEFAESVDRYKD